MDMSRVFACTYPLSDRPAEEAMRIIAAAEFKKVDLLGRSRHFSVEKLRSLMFRLDFNQKSDILTLYFIYREPRIDVKTLEGYR